MTPAKRFFSVQKQLLTLFLKGVAVGRVFTAKAKIVRGYAGRKAIDDTQGC